MTVEERMAMLLHRIAEALANGERPDPYDVRWLHNHWTILEAKRQRDG